MKKTYLVKKDPSLPASEDNWIVMNAYEFQKFMKTEEGKNRRQDFGQMNACGRDDTIIVAECGKETARKWRAEKDCSDYSREMKKRFKWEYISLSDLEDPDGDGTREMSISDEYYDMEEDVFTRMECEQLYRALAKLTRDEILLINELFYSDQNISDLEAGRILGVSRQTIRTQKRAVLNKLRDYLEKGFHV